MTPGNTKRVLNFYDLMLYVALVRKYLRLMALLICMSLLAGLAFYVYSRPVYYSMASIQVDSLSLPLDTDKVFHDSSLYEVINELKSPEVIERTAARLGVTAAESSLETRYIRAIKIFPNTSGGLDVQFWSYLPSWPAHWTEIMVEEFMKLRAEQREHYRDTVTQAYQQELTHLSQKIDDDQDSKFSMNDESNFTLATIDVTRLQQLPIQLAQVKQRIDWLEGIRRDLENPDIDTIDRLSIIASADAESPVRIGQTVTDVTSGIAADAASGSNATLPDATVDPDVANSVVVPGLMAETMEWQHLEERQRELLKEKASLSLVYLPGNQKMAGVDKELGQVQQNLEADYELAMQRFDIVVAGLQSHYAELENKLPEYETARHQYAKIQQTAQLHQAGQLGWTNMYGDAAKTISELEYTADKERVNLSFGHMLEYKEAPVSPNKFKLAILSLLVGIGIAFVIPFLLEYLDYTISNLEQVEATFQMRGLGIIPQIPHDEKQPVLLDVFAAVGDRNLVENFRIVRTNLLAMGALSKPAQVVMVTSAVPKEGKTVISSNLAISFGQTGCRTLLIDSDLRRGRLHRLFGLRKSPGLSDYLIDKVPLDQAIRPSGKENLSILSAGEHLESGTELLGAPKFAELMIHLRTQYDRIIIDTPPILGLSETSVLQSHIDGVLFVIWSGRTPIRSMKTAIDILSANGANFYGFILNRLDLTATTNYYQYYYYSSDYYHSYHALESV